MSTGEKIGGFFFSTLESFPELFGIEPSRTTQEYRALNPVGGFISQAAGAFVPYMGAAKLARAAPLAGRFIRGAEALGATRGPMMRAALGLGAEAAVVEAGRIGIASTPIPEMLMEGIRGEEVEKRGFGTLLGEGAFNIAGSAALGGAAGAVIDRLQRGARIHDVIPGAHPSQPLVKQIRALNEYVAKAKEPGAQVNPRFLARVENELRSRVNFNLGDQLPQYSADGQTFAEQNYRSAQGRLYRRIVGERKGSGKTPGETSNFLNRLANWTSKSPDKSTETRRLIQAERGGFSSLAVLDEMMEKIAPGMTRDDFAMYALDARVTRVKSGVGKKPKAGKVERPGEPDRLLTSKPEYTGAKNLTTESRASGLDRRFMHKSFSDVGQGWRMAKEQDGLFVMAKKIEGELGKPAQGDQWVFFRTDMPEVFAPNAANTLKMTNASPYYPVTPDVVPYADPMFDRMQQVKEVYRAGDEVKGTAAKLGAAGSFMRDTAERIAQKVAPSDPLAASNPILNRVFRFVKDSEAEVETRIGKILYGSQKFGDKTSFARDVLALDAPHTDGMLKFIDELTDDDLRTLEVLVIEEVPFETIKKYFDAKVLTAEGNPLISEKLFGFFRRQQVYSDSIQARAKNLDGRLGASEATKILGEFNARQGHFVLSQNFRGDFRAVLRDDQGRLVGLVPGNSVRSAQEAAEALIAKHAERGSVLHNAGVVETTLSHDIILELRKARSPGFLKSRGNLIGHEFSQGNLTRGQLKKIVEQNIRVREGWFKSMVDREMLVDELSELKRTDSRAFESAQSFLARSVGDEGAAAEVQNKMMDAATLGLLGPNSASKIVRATQNMLFQFTMNFGNVVQPILNVTSILQTVMPEVAFALRASPEQLAKFYLTVPLQSSSGAVKGSMGILSEPKLIASAIKRVWTPKNQLEPEFRELMEKLVADRTIAPRVLEDEIGSKGQILANWKNVSDASDFMGLLKAGNEIMLTKTDEFQRLVSASAVYDVGKLMGLSGDRLHIFARQFMAKTSFNMGTVDRAAVFTTPLGSLMGTFKNWMFHYMANMIRYSSGGKEALPALAWQTASTALIGGAAATPLVMPIADAFSKFMTDKTAWETIYDLTGAENEMVADSLMYGLPGMMGISFASQAASPAADPQRDAQMMFSFAAFDRVKALSTATKDALVAYRTTGESPWEDEKVRAEMVRALAPRTFYRAMAVAENTAVESLTTGYDVTRPLGLGGALLYTAGFNPTELEKTYEAYNIVKTEQRAQKELVQQYGQTLAQAWASGDDRLANRVYARAMATGVDMSSVLRSAEAREERGTKTQLESVSDDPTRFGSIF